MARQITGARELFRSRSVSGLERAFAVRQLAVLLRSGVPLLRSLGVLAEHCSNKRLAEAWNSVKDGVCAGNKLAVSMARNSDVFRLLEVGLVRAGEESASLPQACAFLADLLEAEVRIRERLLSALRYPLLVFGVCLVAMVGLFEHILPSFVATLGMAEKDLPWLTLLLLGVSRVLRDSVVLTIVALVGVIGAFAGGSYLRRPQGKYRLQALLLDMPGVGPLLRACLFTRFCRTLSVLLETGLPLILCLELAGSALGNYPLAEASEIVAADIEDGCDLAEAFGYSRFFPKAITRVVAVGQETGSLAALLRNVAFVYEQQLELAISRMLVALEPVMIGMVGVFVGVVLLGMAAPLYTLLGAV